MVRSLGVSWFIAVAAALSWSAAVSGEGNPMAKATQRPTTRPAEKPPILIPREILFGNPERAGPQISPDGTRMAYLAPDKNNVLQVWMRTIGKKDDEVLTADKRRGIRAYFWAYDKKHLVYIQDSDGDEDYHLYSVNLKTRLVRDVTPFLGVRANLVARNVEFPDQLLVGMNIRDRKVMDVYRITLSTGAIELDTRNPGNIIGWEADANLQVRAADAATADGGSNLLVRTSLQAPWKTIRHWDRDNQGGAVLFSKDGKTLYILDSNDYNTQRLVAVNLVTNESTVIAQDPQYDVGELFIKPVARTIQAVAFNEDKTRWLVLDPSVAGDFDAIRKIRPGAEFVITSRDLADTTWLVVYITDNGPAFYYSYDRKARKATFLFTNQPKLEGLPLALMTPISYPARDGLVLHGYLTLPVGKKPENLPMVLLVHGGPTARDDWGYHPEVQWLANRGYGVLQVNYRGSAGYGKAFLKAGVREWGARMHDDLIDGVNWLVMKGIADPKRIGIMGSSYGGYAVLVGLAFTPEVFAAGVDIVGPSNLLTLLKSIPPYWEPARAAMEYMIGTLKEEKFLKSRSPLFFAHRIKAPLLIGQGANDPRVKMAESEQIVAAMRKAGKPVVYVVFPDEGHGFARPANRLQFYAIAEQFLARYLGGRYEPEKPIEDATGIVKEYQK